MYGQAGKRTSPEPKKRAPKRRKKKGANEPQKPVSAYALFFRDTQAAIKAENSSATFGEISKIVASMWDSLGEDAKQVYKQKTETAKREYLKHLAAFRANMVSKGTFDAEEEDSQPLSVLREKIAEQKATSSSPPFCGPHTSTTATPPVIDLTEYTEDLPPPPKLQLAPGVQLGEPCVKLHPLPVTMATTLMSHNTPSPPDVTSAPRSLSPAPTLTKIIVPGQNGGQSTIHIINSGSGPQSGMPAQHPVTMTAPNAPMKHIVLRPMTPTCTNQQGVTSGPFLAPTPPPIQLRNIVPQPNSPVAVLPNKPGQIIKLLPSETGGITFTSVPTSNVKGRVIKMVDVVYPMPTTNSSTFASSSDEHLQPMTSSPSVYQQLQTMPSKPEEPHVQPILQLLESESSSNQAQLSNISVAQQHNILPAENMDIAPPNLMNSQEGEMVDEDALMLIPQQDLLQTDPQATPITDGMQNPDMYPQNQQNSSPRICVREGCNNLAVSSPSWDNQYCCSECVYSHCRDVFDAWVSTRHLSPSVA